MSQHNGVNIAYQLNTSIYFGGHIAIHHGPPGTAISQVNSTQPSWLVEW
jgi:hypothetical protein